MELTIEQKIKYADIVARVMVFASVLFVGFGAVVRMTVDQGLGNMILFTGLIFIALLGVAAYTKKKLEASIEAGKPFIRA